MQGVQPLIPVPIVPPEQTGAQGSDTVPKAPEEVPGQRQKAVAAAEAPEGIAWIRRHFRELLSVSCVFEACGVLKLLFLAPHAITLMNN